MNELPQVSVVIPAFNCQKTISQTIQALLRQSYKGLIEIVVVDDGSTDDTKKIIQGFPMVKYVYQNNAGPAKARNRGFETSKGQVVFFTDSDCIPHQDWIETMLEGFEGARVSVVCGSYGIVNRENLLARCIHQEIRFRHLKLMPEYPKAFGSYNFCILRRVFDEVGGFDASYRRASGEDNDLSYKVLKKGYKIRFQKEALVDHHHPERLGKYLREQFQHGFWRVKMYQEHPQMIQGDGYTFWKDAVEVLLVFLCWASLIFLSRDRNLSLYALIFFNIILLMLEFLFSLRIVQRISEVFYFSIVMCLRAFTRTLGFSTAFLVLPVSKLNKIFAKKI